MRRLLIVALSVTFASPFASAAGAEHTGNIRFSPIGLLIGYVNVDADFPINPNWTLGPTVSYWKWNTNYPGFASDISASRYSLGARGNWYKNGIYTHSLYVSPLVQYVSANVSSGSVSASASVIALSGLVGYHWFWKSFNLNIGGGLMTFMGPAKVKVTDSSGATTTDVEFNRLGGLQLDFMLGFLF